jgi:hypothetical protein
MIIVARDSRNQDKICRFILERVIPRIHVGIVPLREVQRRFNKVIGATDGYGLSLKLLGAKLDKLGFPRTCRGNAGIGWRFLITKDAIRAAARRWSVEL